MIKSVPFSFAGMFIILCVIVFSIVGYLKENKFEKINENLKLTEKRVTLKVDEIKKLEKEINKLRQEEVEFKNVTIRKEQDHSNIPEFATPNELVASYLKNKTIRIADLVREDLIVRNRTFEDCYIYGPAVIFPMKNNSLIESVFYGEIDDLFIVIPNKKKRFLVGVIGIENCTFIKCNLIKIGFVSFSNFKQKFEKTVKEIK